MAATQAIVFLAFLTLGCFLLAGLCWLADAIGRWIARRLE